MIRDSRATQASNSPLVLANFSVLNAYRVYIYPSVKISIKYKIVITMTI